MRASRAENQRRFRARTDKQRIEVYLAPEVVAELDAMPGSRAQVITNLVAQRATGSNPPRDRVERATGSREPIQSTAQLIADTKPPKRTFLLDDGTAITVNAIKTANGGYRHSFMVNGRRISRANLERKLAE
ncbi:MAG: hypothetical protein L0H73_07085 [Nitrococcus sp.]|nr:hypothetical protein [Nitrococcus sp.]